MACQVVQEKDYFIVATRTPILCDNLDVERARLQALFQEYRGSFQAPEWTADTVPCKDSRWSGGYWNHLNLRQKGVYGGRKMGVFGSTNSLRELFCGPYQAGDVIMNEAAARKGACNSDPRYHHGRKAERTDAGSINIGIVVLERVPESSSILDLLEKGTEWSREIWDILS